jgi:hypothetical protein
MPITVTATGTITTWSIDPGTRNSRISRIADSAGSVAVRKMNCVRRAPPSTRAGSSATSSNGNASQLPAAAIAASDAIAAASIAIGGRRR